MTNQRKCVAVIRVRGTSGIPQKTKNTLDMLRLNRNCRATLIDNRPSYIGMLRKAHNLLTWGEISEEVLKQLIRSEYTRIFAHKPL